MLISVINLAEPQIDDGEVQRVIRAINRQIAEDFESYWGFGATLRLEGKSSSRPRRQAPVDMRGEAILYLMKNADVEDALGYHDSNFRGIPCGFVYTALSEQLGEPWTVTFSHEALELVGDPQANLLAQGPHPHDRRRMVFHWFEMCDAVQGERYEIDGVEVANFVLPLYFTGSEEAGARNDFLHRSTHGERLRSFGINRGGYVGFYDPKLRKHVTVSRDEDEAAQRRMRLKGRFGSGRGSMRKRQGSAPLPPLPSNRRR